MINLKFRFVRKELAICKSRNEESENGMRGMIGIRGIRVGMRRIRVGMWEMRGIRMGMQGIMVGMRGIGVGKT